jgi:site-specific recombinase XerD
MYRTWVFQDPKQKAKHGDKCPWAIGWYDPEGKKRQETIGTKGQANKAAAKKRAELVEGTYNPNQKKTWAEFRAEFIDTVADRKAANTRRAYVEAFDHFQRIIKPKRMEAITSKTIDKHVSKRRKEESKRRPGEKVAPASINKELRHLKAAFRKAKKWKYLREAPDIEMEREPDRIPEYATSEDFAALYEACCTVANHPKGLTCDPVDWWRGVFVFAYMTGWRISEVLSLRRADLDLRQRTAKVDAYDTKGKRDAVVDLHPLVIEHI